MPEGVGAVRVADVNRLQIAANLGLGSALATIGLTIPAVAAASIVLGPRGAAPALVEVALYPQPGSPRLDDAGPLAKRCA